MKSKVVSVLLNYNSNSDLFLSIGDLLKQSGILQTIIVVDNNSTKESRRELVSWQQINHTNAIAGSPREVRHKIVEEGHQEIIFIYNNINAGYSAGNNVGIRVAEKLDSDHVFIVNPDMRIHDKDYLKKLIEHAESDDNAVIVASRIVGVDGENQSPMVADDFWREFLWPKQLFPKLFKQPKFIEKIDSESPVYVSKVMGCAMLLKMDFLKKTGFLDETTFLYSEEAILSSQVKSLDKKIKFVPSLTAYHIHKKENKDNSSKRMLLMLKSRAYYINNYSTFSRFEKICLFISLRFCRYMHFLKLKAPK